MGKLALPFSVEQWFERARAYPHVAIEPIEPEDAIASTGCREHFTGIPPIE